MEVLREEAGNRRSCTHAPGRTSESYEKLLLLLLVPRAVLALCIYFRIVSVTPTLAVALGPHHDNIISSPEICS